MENISHHCQGKQTIKLIPSTFSLTGLECVAKSTSFFKIHNCVSFTDYDLWRRGKPSTSTGSTYHAGNRQLHKIPLIFVIMGSAGVIGKI
jgi:hypothetical protein